MFKFDPSKVVLQRVKLKNVSMALGGSITYLDEEHFESTGEEKFIRLEAPMHMCRMFQVRYKAKSFIKPAEGAILLYDGNPIAVELSSLKDRIQQSFEGQDRLWISKIDVNWRNVQREFMNDDQSWYFDGIFIYRFRGTTFEAVEAGEPLDENNNFRSIECEAIKLSTLAFDMPIPETRCCVAYVAYNNEFSISAPIWKSIGSKFAHHKDKESGGLSENDSLAGHFEDVDAAMAINLNFSLHAARTISDAFGYESIEPLNLPWMMIQLKTVNLPKVVKEIKASHDTGLQFTHVMAWLLGLQRKAINFSQFLHMRKVIKYLTTKGLFRKDQLSKQRIFKEEEYTTADIPLLTMDQAWDNVKMDSVMEAFKNQVLQRKAA